MKNSVKFLLAVVIAATGWTRIEADTTSEAGSKTSGEVSLEGVVTARSIMGETKGFFFLQDDAGGVGVVMEGDQKDLPRAGYQIKLTAEATDKSYLNYKAMELVNTNANMPRLTVVRDASDAGAVKDALGKYAVVPGTKFEGSKFKGGEMIKIATSNAKFDAVTSMPLDGYSVPQYDFNFFGVIASNDIVGGDGSGNILVTTRVVPVSASETRKFATQQTCFTCHLVDKKLVGPAYLWVAQKYKNDPDAISKMVEQIENGGMGKWGPIPMIGFKGRLNNDQMTELADWIHEMRWELILNE